MPRSGEREAQTKFRAAALLLAALVLPLAGCTKKPHGAISRNDCGGGRIITVEWSKDLAIVTADGETWRLPRAISGSGARYSDGIREAWEHQGMLRWTVPGAAAVECKRISVSR